MRRATSKSGHSFARSAAIHCASCVRRMRLYKNRKAAAEEIWEQRVADGTSGDCGERAQCARPRFT